MRILLANHAPLGGPEGGAETSQLASALLGAGHEVRALALTALKKPPAEPYSVRYLVCQANREADLGFEIPWLDSADRGPMSFERLTDQELTDYRHALRTALDEQIAEFDPQLVHAQHLWLPAHLALEAGVPYVVSSYGAELDASHRDPRYRRFAEEAAENACRILAASEATRRRIQADFGELDGRVLVSPSLASSGDFAAWITALYRKVLHERFGDLPTLED